MTGHDARLLPGALAGVVACHLVGTGASAVAVCGIGLALAVVGAAGAAVVRRHGWREGGVAVALAATLAVMLAAGAAWRLDLRLSTGADEADEHGARTTVAGTVVEPPVLASPDRFTGQPRWRAVLAADQVAGQPARARVVVYVTGTAPVGDPPLAWGERVQLRGTLGQAVAPRDAAVVWHAEVTSRHPAAGFTRAVAHVRERARLTSESLPAPVRDLALGMAIGDDSRMPATQADAMRRTGLVHLTAVSGSHFAVVIAAARWLLRRLKLPRWTQAAALGAVAVAFTAVVLAQPAVLRALTAAAAIVLGLAWGRPARAVPALSAGVLVLLALDPFLASALGFQLSVAAVAALALWAPHLAHRWQRWLAPWLARTLAIPVAASAATAPLLLVTVGGIGPYTVPANLLAAATAAPVTLLGLAAVILGPMWSTAAEAVWHLAGGAAWPVALVAAAFAGAPGAWWEPQGAWAVTGVLAALVLAVIGSVSRRVRGWGALAIAAAAVASLAAVPAFTAWSAVRMAQWDVVACDVGQGDAMLLRSGPDSAVVIDVGPPDGDVEGCLSRHGVRRIDLLILTHPHQDHDGAVAQVLAAVPVSRAWVGAASADALSTRVLRAAAVPVETVERGATATVGRATLTVLGPPHEQRGWGANDSSVVVLAQAGAVSVLALGDAELDAQRALVNALGGPAVVDVVKVAHHGSAVQDERLANLITARVAIFSAGRGNPFGHPTPAALDLYGERVVTVQRTDLCGDILVGFDGAVRVASRCPPLVAG